MIRPIFSKDIDAKNFGIIRLRPPNFKDLSFLGKKRMNGEFAITHTLLPIKLFKTMVKNYFNLKTWMHEIELKLS